MSEFGSAHGREVASRAVHENFERIVDLIRAARDAGEIRSDINARVVASALITGNLNVVLYRTVMGELIGESGTGARGAYCAATAGMVLDGIRKERQPA